MYIFLLKFKWKSFLQFQFTIAIIGSQNGLAQNRRQTIIQPMIAHFIKA